MFQGGCIGVPSRPPLCFSQNVTLLFIVSDTRSCPTLCNPVDYTVHGILQARILKWVAFPSPEDLPDPGIESRSPAPQADSLPAELPGKPSDIEAEVII